MRVLPLIEGDSCDYTRLQAIAWSSGGVSTLRWMNDLVSKQIVRIIERHESKPLVIDCRGMQGIADHAFDVVRDQLLATARPIMFMGASTLRPSLEQGLGSPTATYHGEFEFVVYARAGVPTRDEADAIAKRALDLLPRYLQNSIARSFRKFERSHRLLSTPLIADGVFDARRIIADPEHFIWCSIALADTVQSNIDEWFLAAGKTENATSFWWLKDLRILAVSLRSSPFAASVGLLCGNGLENRIEIVDHVGPKHRILEEHRLGAATSRGQYVLISDFVIGGTELKIAKAYAEMRGGGIQLVTALGAYLEPDSYGIPLMPLVNLRSPDLSATFRF